MATLIGICKKDEEKLVDMFEQLKDHQGCYKVTSSILADL